MMGGKRMPVGFVGHGNPLNAVDPGRNGPWRSWGGSLPRPLAILAVSAHWEEAPVTIGSTRNHEELLYDFWGFPDYMYRLRYPAPGAPGLADRVEDLLEPHFPIIRTDRLVDHGVWVPAMHIWPDADVPLLQISMPASMTDSDLYDLGSELTPLRDEGIFILGTGNIVHNLGAARLDADPPPPEYVHEFDSWTANALRNHDHRGLVSWRERAPEPLRSHPSAEHYRPLIVAAGASQDGDAGFPVTGFEHGTISRRSVTFS